MAAEHPICWGGSQGEHPCTFEASNPSGLCDRCEAFAISISEGLKTRFAG